MSIDYEYTSYNFTRKNLEPVTEEEYNLMKDDIGHFIEVFYHQFKKQKKNEKNPHRFNVKLFVIFILSAVGIFGISWVVGLMGYPEAAEIISIPAIIPILAIIFQPIQYFMSGTKSSVSEVHYRRAANTYFRFHDSVMDEAQDYAGYRKVLASKTEQHFEVFADRNQ
jgi:hypothetical protein